ncbi:MAG: hypothetical protein WDZ49_13100 [Litorilinea sp.]
MNLWLAFLGGIILGWLIEWIIDWYYWRRGVDAFYSTETELRRQLQNVQAEKEAAHQAQAELREQLAQAQAELAQLRGAPTSASSTPPASPRTP